MLQNKSLFVEYNFNSPFRQNTLFTPLPKNKRKKKQKLYIFSNIQSMDCHHNMNLNRANRPFAARGHVLGYRLATQNWIASVPVDKGS